MAECVKQRMEATNVHVQKGLREHTVRLICVDVSMVVTADKLHKETMNVIVQ